MYIYIIIYIYMYTYVYIYILCIYVSIYIYIYYTLQLNLMYLVLPGIQDWHDGKLCCAAHKFRFVVQPGSVTFAKVHSETRIKKCPRRWPLDEVISYTYIIYHEYIIHTHIYVYIYIHSFST